MLRFLTSLARDINPTATLMPAGQDNMKGVQGELDEMNGWMRSSDADTRAKYWGSPKAQERYRELLTAQERMQKPEMSFGTVCPQPSTVRSRAPRCREGALFHFSGAQHWNE